MSLPQIFKCFRNPSVYSYRSLIQNICAPPRLLLLIRSISFHNRSNLLSRCMKDSTITNAATPLLAVNFITKSHDLVRQFYAYFMLIVLLIKTVYYHIYFNINDFKGNKKLCIEIAEPWSQAIGQFFYFFSFAAVNRNI